MSMLSGQFASTSRPNGSEDRSRMPVALRLTVEWSPVADSERQCEIIHGRREGKLFAPLRLSPLFFP